MTPLTVVSTPTRPNTTTLLPLEKYDLCVVSFSGGKDSVALVLRLLDLGVPKDKIQLWHQSIDGRPKFLGGEPKEPAFLMDWPITESYCIAFARALGFRLLFSWKQGGFAGELFRKDSLTAPTSYECQDGLIRSGGGVRGKPSTRMLFPQVSADLSVRYCSAYLKIDVAAMAINGDPAFKTGQKILYLSGERRQESTARSRYAEMEKHRTSNNKRRVDHWRAIIDYSEQQVWDIVRRYRINPHPAYWLGYGRVSCLDCIFADADQIATNRYMDPFRFENLACVEDMTGKTIKRGKSLRELADAGKVHPEAKDVDLVQLAMGHTYPEGLALLSAAESWQHPPGAFKKSGGPI